MFYALSTLTVFAIIVGAPLVAGIAFLLSSASPRPLDPLEPERVIRWRRWSALFLVVAWILLPVGRATGVPALALLGSASNLLFVGFALAAAGSGRWPRFGKALLVSAAALAGFVAAARLIAHDMEALGLALLVPAAFGAAIAGRLSRGGYVPRVGAGSVAAR